MVTYEQLFDALRREKSRDELQELGEGFYGEARRFLAEKREEAEKRESLTAQKAEIEYRNSQRVLRELYDRRERKIVTLAMHRTRTDAAVVDRETLLSEERKLFDDVVEKLKESRRDILSGDIPPAPPEPKKEQESPEKDSSDEDPVEKEESRTEATSEPTITVKFTATVPKFVGKDMTVYGPYEEGQQANLPESVAKILVDKGRASTS